MTPEEINAAIDGLDEMDPIDAGQLLQDHPEIRAEIYRREAEGQS